MNYKLYKHKVQYYETDQMGITHHSNYIRWFEEARVDLMEQLGFGYKEMETHEIYSPVLSVSCQYCSMTHFYDTVIILPEVEIYTGVKLSLTYKVLDTISREVKTTGRSSHCFLNKKGRPISLKRVLPEIHELFSSITKKDLEEISFLPFAAQK